MLKLVFFYILWNVDILKLMEFYDIILEMLQVCKKKIP